MSLADVLASAAIVVSVLAACFTLYFQYFERRRVAVALGDEIYLAYGERDGSGGYSKLGIVLSLSLINSGACDALVTLITATVRQAPTGFSTEARWRSFYEPTEVTTPSLPAGPRWKFIGWVRPLAASSRKVVTEWIYFSSTPLASALPIGEYVFELAVTETRPSRINSNEGTDEIERRPLALWVGSFTIDETAASYLVSSCVAQGGITPDSYRVNLRRRQSEPLWSTSR